MRDTITNKRPATRVAAVPLPREHGSWVLLLGPFVLAVVAYGGPDPRLVLLLISLTGLFLAREPLVSLLRQGRVRSSPQRSSRLRWLGIDLLVSLLAGLPLLVVWRLLDLLLLLVPALVFLVIHLRIVQRREERTLGGEWIGVLGLCLSAPAACVVIEGGLNTEALTLYLLSVLFFSSGLLHVRMMIARALNRNPQPAVSRSVAYHCSLAVAMCVGMVLDWISPWVALAFVPALVRAFWPLLDEPGGRLNLKRTGYLEILYGLVFIVTAGLALRF